MRRLDEEPTVEHRNDEYMRQSEDGSRREGGNRRESEGGSRREVGVQNTVLRKDGRSELKLSLLTG